MPVQWPEDLGPGTRLLIRWIRGESDCRVFSEADWRAILAACEYHQVAPIVFHRMEAVGHAIPCGVQEEFRALNHRIAAYNYFLAAQLVRLTDEFEKQEIPVLVLKGPAVAMGAYGDLGLRQYEDIDLVVPRAHVSKGVEMMLRRGFQPMTDQGRRYKDPERFHEVTMASPDGRYALDLHWQLAPPYARPFGPDISEVWQHAERLTLTGRDVLTLSREDLFLVLCQHGARHRWWQLKWLFDVAELLRHAHQIDWLRMGETLKPRPMARQAAGLAALLVSELLGVAVPDAVTRLLAPEERTRTVARAIRDEFLSRGMTSGSAHDTLLGLEQRPLVRVKYMAIEAFQYPVRQVLFTITGRDLQFVALPERLRLLYYVIRPVRLLIEHGRAAARRIWSMAR